MPYLEGTNKHFHYADYMKSDDFNLLHSREHSGAFQRAIEEMWSRHVFQNAYELVDAMQKTGQFEEELADLNNPEPDYEEAAADNEVCIVDGEKEVFYFKWDDLSTIEVTSHTEAMIDYQRFAKDNGLNLDEWRWDADNEEVVHRESDMGRTLTDHSNALEGYIDAEGGIDGENVQEFLEKAAEAAGLTDFANRLGKTEASALYGDYINKGYYTQTQNNENIQLAAENACDEYGIDADDYRPEVMEHWAIDNDLARALKNQGESVVELAGFKIWGRCTTGQSVVLDHCVQQTYIHEFPYAFDAFVKQHMPEVAQRIESEVRAEFELEQQQKQENAPAAPSI